MREVPAFIGPQAIFFATVLSKERAGPDEHQEQFRFVLVLFEIFLDKVAGGHLEALGETLDVVVGELRAELFAAILAFAAVDLGADLLVKITDHIIELFEVKTH